MKLNRTEIDPYINRVIKELKNANFKFNTPDDADDDDADDIELREPSENFPYPMVLAYFYIEDISINIRFLSDKMIFDVEHFSSNIIHLICPYDNNIGYRMKRLVAVVESILHTNKLCSEFSDDVISRKHKIDYLLEDLDDSIVN
jgi:hypothetical protein